MSDNRKIDPSRLTRMMRERKMTQIRLSELSGVERSYISQLCGGKTKTRHQNEGTIKALAEALDCYPEYLTGETDFYSEEFEKAYKRMTKGVNNLIKELDEKVQLDRIKTILSLYRIKLTIDTDSEQCELYDNRPSSDSSDGVFRLNLTPMKLCMKCSPQQVRALFKPLLDFVDYGERIALLCLEENEFKEVIRTLN